MSVVSNTSKLVNERFAALRKGFQSLIRGVQEADEGALFGRLTERRESTASTENFSWVDSLASACSWSGDRQFHDLVLSSFDVEPRHKESSVAIDRNDLADERQDLRAFTDQIQAVSAAFPRARRSALAAKLANGFTETPCHYDGENANTTLFDTGHPVYEVEYNEDGDPVYHEKGTFANVPTDGSGNAEHFNLAANLTTADRISDLISKMSRYTTLSGKLIDAEPDTMIVPSTNRRVAKKLVGNSQIFDASAGELRSNPLFDEELDLISEPMLDRQGMSGGFILADTDNPRIVPFLHMVRQPVRTEMAGPDSEHAMKQNEILYGADSRFAVVPGMPQAFAASNGSDGTLATA